MSLKNILIILSATDRNDVERKCSQVSLNLTEFPGVVEYLKGAGFQHQLLAYEKAIDNVKLTAKNMEGLQDISKPPSQKTLRKLIGNFDTQQVIKFFGHLFIKGDEWHLFYFSGASLEGNESGNFWGGKPHVHYLCNKHGRNLEEIRSQIKMKIGTLNGEHIAIE